MSALDEARSYLKESLTVDVAAYFGLRDQQWIDETTEQWFNERSDYDGRWHFLRTQGFCTGQVLDVGAGCGTFLLGGLLQGYDVSGIEPEKWKHEYLRKKVLASGYPSDWGDRMRTGFAEALPWPDASFDVVTSYQTLEHVQDVERALREMLRVVRPGGFLYLRSPDYDSFYEPHYRIPFLPQMNKRFAAFYLRLLGRPLKGLESLNWTTERQLRASIASYVPGAHIQSRADRFRQHRRRVAERLVPKAFSGELVLRSLVRLLNFRAALRDLRDVGRAEKQLDLWVAIPENAGTQSHSSTLS